jgi:hypothetical protein
MPGQIKIDDGAGNYTILTNAGSLGSDKTITIPNTTGTMALTSDISAGLVYINSGTFSAVSSVSIDSVFTSTYKDYLILIEFTDNSADNTQTSLQLRSSSSTVNTNYVSQNLQAEDANVGGLKNQLGTDEWDCIPLDQTYTYGGFVKVHLRSPEEAKATHMLLYGNGTFGTNTLYVYNTTGVHNDTTQCDGFQINVVAGTITGNWKVYGLSDS